MPKRIPPFRDERVHVLREQCSTCIFRPGNLMHLNPGRLRDLVEANHEREAALTCHKTLAGEEAICKGFFDKTPTWPLRLAESMGVIEWVDPPE